MKSVLDRIVNVLTIVAAVWLVLIAVVIFLEVTGRGLLGVFLGGNEIVTNSVPAIVFLQVPLAVQAGTMLRTTIVYDNLGRRGKSFVNIASYVCGIVLFVAIAVGGWDDMIRGWEIKEYQGIGALEVPVYPIRTIIIVSAILTFAVYASLIVREVLGEDTADAAVSAGSGTSER